MEQDHGLYLAPYKYERGQSLTAKKKNAKGTIKMISGAIANVQMDELARRMTRTLEMFSYVTLYERRASKRKRYRESGRCHETQYSLNCLRKEQTRCVLDSFGNLRPLKELLRYFGNDYDDRVQLHFLSDI